MLNEIVLGEIMLSVVLVVVSWLDVIILSDFIMGVVMLTIITLNVVKQLRTILPSLAEH